MTIGEYIKELLVKKEISVTNAKELIGVSSRSAVYRLFQGAYAPEKTVEMVEKLVSKVDFSKEEKDRIYELLGSKRVSNFFYNTIKILSYIYMEQLPSNFKFTYNGETKSFADVLNECANTDSVIFVSDIDNIALVNDIYEFAKANSEINIYNYMQFQLHRTLTAYEIFSLIMFSPCKNHIPLHADKPTFRGVCIITKYVDKYFIRILENGGEKYEYMETEITEVFYNNIMRKHEKYNNTCKKILEPYSVAGDYLRVVRDETVYERCQTIYSEGSICFGVLKFEILLELFKEANYFGFPENHKYTVAHIEVFRQRSELYLNGENSSKILILDRKKIEEMMHSSRSFQHFSLMPSMNKKQCKVFFEYLLKLAKERPDNNLHCQNITDAQNGRGYILNYNNKALSEIMNDFMQYVIEDLTLSHDESIIIMENLMNKIFD